MGVRLLKQLMQLRMDRGAKSELKLSCYKTFDSFILELLEQMHSLGKFNDEVFTGLLSILKKDINFQKKLEQSLSKGLMQLLSISFITFVFLLYAARSLEVPTPSFSIGLIALAALMGTICILAIYKCFLILKFRAVDRLIESILLLRAYSQLNLSMQKAIDLAKIGELFQLNWRQQEIHELFIWLVETVEIWKKQGGDMAESLDHLIEQAITHREIIQQSSYSQIQMTIFLCSCCFGLFPFLFGIYRLIASYSAF